MNGGFVRFCAVFLTALGSCRCLPRVYYVGIREVDWDYAPSGRNLINGLTIDQDEHASVFLSRSSTRIGSVYKKAVYKQYTDDTYSTESPRPDWLGFLGPVFRGEVGDDIVVRLKNFGSRRYSLHPHGVFYDKSAEGALYPDGTSGNLKDDDGVPPGSSYTYTWKVTEEFAPTKSDSSCLTWIYHSHIDAPRDIAAGLIGVLLTCKKGVLDTSGVQRSDVDQEVVLMFSVVDENLSWYLDDNIARFSADAANLKEDEDFHESNLMHSINGYVYGNMPPLDLCLGKTVGLHLFGIGNEVDIHSAYFHGHTMIDRGHRTDVLSLFPATFVTAKMVPMTTGKWMISCQVNDHMLGMQAFYQVSACDQKDTAPKMPPGQERNFYIAAEEVLWDYAPLGINIFTNEPLDAEGSDSFEFFSKQDGRLGGKYWKARYIAYTDNTFTTKYEQHGSEHHLGLLGPVIRGEPGDVIVITFRNLASREYSLQPHGLAYDKPYEGALYEDGSQKLGARVAPGQTFTYRWKVAEGPSFTDPPCLSYLYYSATNPVRDTNSGLVGPLQVCKEGVLDGSGRQHIGSEVLKEFFLLFSVIDENESWYLEKNIESFGSAASDMESPIFEESNKMHSVNGYMYGSLPNLDVCQGDRVVWHMLGLGTEVDIHGVYFQGNTFLRAGNRQDTLSLFPHTSVTVSMKPDNNGVFGLSCTTTDHYRGGMRQQYTVKSCAPNQKPPDTTFRPDVYFYLAAEEVLWNYAPDRTWELEKHQTHLEESPGSVFLTKSENRIGPEYKKVVYRQYTDDTFTTRLERGPDEEHLGILGPILRVEVGENVQVVFKNKATRPYSVHAHGVKTNEQNLSPVSPNDIARYNWIISSGPESTDPNCITFAYYSSADFVKDLASGLVGPLLVCNKGTLDNSRRRRNVQKEFALLFMVFDENESWYLEDNIETYLNKQLDSFDTSDGGFMESNMMHGINGKMYANLHGLNMRQGDLTEWYLMGLGNEIDMHTAHFHAQSFIYKTDFPHRADVYDLFPGTFKTVEMVAGTPGTWLLHCHVTDHIHAGMETTFTVHPASKATRKKKNSITFENSKSLFPKDSGSTRLQFSPELLLFIPALFWLH